MAEFDETVIDHVVGDDWCGVSSGEDALKFRLYRFAKKYPDDVQLIAHNDDGSMYFHVPWDWVLIRKPKQMNFSDEEIKKRTDRIKMHHQDGRVRPWHDTIDDKK